MISYRIQDPGLRQGSWLRPGQAVRIGEGMRGSTSRRHIDLVEDNPPADYGRTAAWQFQGEPLSRISLTWNTFDIKNESSGGICRSQSRSGAW